MAQRPMLIGLLVTAFGVCSILGPILGGVLSGTRLSSDKTIYTDCLTERVSWRYAGSYSPFVRCVYNSPYI